MSPAALPPLLVRPRYVVKPWGGRRLATELGRTDLPDGPIGESFEVYDTEDAPALIDGGALDGRPLTEALGRRFPLLLKVIDAREHLSVQLHPDGRDDAPPKDEAWIALGDGGSVAIAPPTCRPPDAGASWLDVMERVPLTGGDAVGDTSPTLVHIPPGTVHAILAGSLVFEVQNPVNITWRLDDYGRPGIDGKLRPLHLQEAAPVLARGAMPKGTVSEGGRRLEGTRFGIRLLAPGTHTLSGVAAVFCGRGGRLTQPAQEPFEVPPGRTVVLTQPQAEIETAGWSVATWARS